MYSNRTCACVRLSYELGLVELLIVSRLGYVRTYVHVQSTCMVCMHIWGGGGFVRMMHIG